MTKVISIITGLFLSLSLITPAFAAVQVEDFDTLSGNGSLYQRITSGQLDQRIHDYATLFDAITGKPVSFDQTSFEAQNQALKIRYVQAYECRMHVSVAACQRPKTK